jgi:hypothetical protein
MKESTEQLGRLSAAEFIDCQVTAISFAAKALGPLKKLYRDIHVNALERGVRMGKKEHEDYSGFEGVKMRWYFANSPKAISIFRGVVDGCNLKRAREIVGTCPDLVRIVQASIIEVVGSYPRGRWHSDFTDKELGLNQSATMLTPLFTFQRNFGGLELTAVKRGMPLDFDEYSHVYRYCDGEAVLFDGSGMVHRTQSYRANAMARRVLVCWQFADTCRVLRPALKRIGNRTGDPMFFVPH